MNVSIMDLDIKRSEGVVVGEKKELIRVNKFKKQLASILSSLFS